MEGVEADAFTEVLKSRQGKVGARRLPAVELLDERTRLLRWSQQIEDTPFARLLQSAETELRLEPAGAAART